MTTREVAPRLSADQHHLSCQVHRSGLIGLRASSAGRPLDQRSCPARWTTGRRHNWMTGSSQPGPRSGSAPPRRCGKWIREGVEDYVVRSSKLGGRTSPERLRGVGADFRNWTERRGAAETPAAERGLTAFTAGRLRSRGPVEAAVPSCDLPSAVAASSSARAAGQWGASEVFPQSLGSSGVGVRQFSSEARWVTLGWGRAGSGQKLQLMGTCCSWQIQPWRRLSPRGVPPLRPLSHRQQS
jgi:hypothetical protein